MRHEAGKALALRIGYWMGTRSHYARLAAGCSMIVFCAGLSGCADESRYPTLSKISDLENILSPEERQKAMQDLQKQEQSHGSDAVKAIEKPSQ